MSRAAYAQRKVELKATGFKSWLEVEVANVLTVMTGQADYEPDRLPYIIPAKKHIYTPDFKLDDSTYIEVKGVLDNASRKKLLFFRDSNPNIKILLLFDKPYNKLKSGSKTTYAAWAEKNGFEWADWKYGIPQHWVNEKENNEF